MVITQLRALHVTAHTIERGESIWTGRKLGDYFGMGSDSSETLTIRQGCFGPIAGKHNQDIISQNGKLHKFRGELSVHSDSQLLRDRISCQCWDR